MFCLEKLPVSEKKKGLLLFHVFTVALKRKGYFCEKTRRAFLSKSSQKLMNGQISKFGFSGAATKYFKIRNPCS